MIRQFMIDNSAFSSKVLFRTILGIVMFSALNFLLLTGCNRNQTNKEVEKPKVEKPKHDTSLVAVKPEYKALQYLSLEDPEAEMKKLHPVKWETSFIKTNKKDEYELVFKAKIDKGWVIYSQFLEGNDGPYPTSISFDQNGIIADNSAYEAGYKIQGYDDMFAKDIIKFMGPEAYFSQRIKVKKDQMPVTGVLSYMTCDNTRCMPPRELKFSLEPVNAE